MKPAKRYVIRHPDAVRLRELEDGDRPVDQQGRALSFVPGDLLVDVPFHTYVLARELADKLYIELED